MSDAPARRGREVTVLAVLLAVAVVIIGMLLLRPSSQGAQGSTGATSTAAAGSGAASATPTPARTVRDTARHQADDRLALGRPDAPVTMVEYADFACPFCARFARSTQPELVRRYVDTGVLRIEWHDLVIFGDKSQHAARAARAAGAQGRFWQFHDALFAASPTDGHPDLTDDKLLGFARAAGVPDLDRWRRDMASPAVDQAVSTETATAQSLGASSTPVFVVNGAPVVGAQPDELFHQVIDQAARAAGH